jgi:hypothetical protein
MRPVMVFLAHLVKLPDDPAWGIFLNCRFAVRVYEGCGKTRIHEISRVNESGRVLHEPVGDELREHRLHTPHQRCKDRASFLESTNGKETNTRVTGIRRTPGSAVG